MQARGSTLVARPADTVFAFISDPAHDHLWRSHLVSSRGSSSAIGDHITQSYEYEGHRKSVELEVTERQPPERLTYSIRAPISVRMSFQCRPEGGGTRVSFSMSANLSGPAALFESRAQSELEKLIKSDLGRLRDVLEGL